MQDPKSLFQQGIDLFNRREFFECHEVLEEVWTPTGQPDRWFLQSLIHFAVGFYHHRNNNYIGATRQLRKGITKIQSYLPEWDGVDTRAIERASGVGAAFSAMARNGTPCQRLSNLLQVVTQ